MCKKASVDTAAQTPKKDHLLKLRNYLSVSQTPRSASLIKSYSKTLNKQRHELRIGAKETVINGVQFRAEI